MIHCNLHVILLLISSLFPINSALNKEELVGGYAAFQPNHKYNVAIVGRHNYSLARILLCTGSIVSDFFILSSAQCFITTSLYLRKLKFYAIVGSVSLKYHESLTKEITNIYTHERNCIVTKNDIAVLELKESLNLKDNPDLGSIELPSKNDTFKGRSGVVAGYGFTTIDEMTNREVRVKSRVTVTSGQNLTYAYAYITKSRHCKEAYINIIPAKEMCGVIRPDINYKHRGLCTNDLGSPLVIDDKLVGIAKRNRKDCNDTVFGGLYSKVSYFLDFIQSVMAKTLLPNIMVYSNRPHLRGVMSEMYLH